MNQVMKRNLIRLLVVGLLATLWLLYFNWDRHYRGERKAQKITCVNNLKQIGLAFRVWEGDHDDKFPFQVSTNAGGTLELCDRDTNGFDRNALAHFLVMTNELNTPLLLCCPDDHSKIVVREWSSLSVSNISYRLRTGPKVSESNPREILAVCPVDGNVLYTDGSVEKGDHTPITDEDGRVEMRVGN